MEVIEKIIMNGVDIRTPDTLKSAFADKAYVTCDGRVYTSVDDILNMGMLIDIIAEACNELLPVMVDEMYSYTFVKLVKYAKIIKENS